MIPQSTIDKVINRSEIVEVISDFITLNKRGINYKGLCPFHNEKTPSFTVSPAKNIYKCFGCGKGGNPVNFVMEHEQLSFVEAIKYLARKYNIEVEERQLTAKELEQKNERESLLIINDFAKELFIKNLRNTDEGLSVAYSYLKERGFRDDIIKKFQVGYCLKQSSHFTDQALKSGYKKKYLVETGLTIEHNDKQCFDRFRGRIMFPIYTLSGRISGFGGRTLSNNKKTAKYLNSPESLVYNKSKILYGIYQARTNIVKNDRCYLVEGYTDVMALHQAGIENVVASSGTALTKEQIYLIKRFTKNITVIYDGDIAGIKASLRGIDILLEQGMNVKTLPLPENEDPDSFSKSMNATALQEYIEKNELDFIKFKTQLLLEEAEKDPIKKAHLISSIMQSIALIPDQIIRSVYLKETSTLLQVEENILYSEVQKIRNTTHKPQTYKKTEPTHTSETSSETKQTQGEKPQENPCENEEKRLIYLLLHYGENNILIQNAEGETKTTTVKEYIILQIFGDELYSVNPTYQFIFDKIKENLNTPEFNIEKYLHTHIDSKVTSLVADILSLKYKLSYKFWTKDGQIITKEEDKLQEFVPKAINQYKFRKIRTLLKENENKIANDPENLDQHLTTHMKLKEIEKQITRNIGNIVIMK